MQLDFCNDFVTSIPADRHPDKSRGGGEAIHRRAVDAGTLQPSGSATAEFKR
jgi:hypothetical protein